MSITHGFIPKEMGAQINTARLATAWADTASDRPKDETLCGLRDRLVVETVHAVKCECLATNSHEPVERNA